jgi:hypothetical protein
MRCVHSWRAGSTASRIYASTRSRRSTSRPASDVSKAVAGRNYDELMPIFNPTGHFNPKALDVLSRSFIELGRLPDAPDMSKLYTEAFLPK